MLGAGDLLIESGGEDGQQRFTDIRNPDQVQQPDPRPDGTSTRSRMFQRHGARAAVDVATQLEKLEGLRDRGSLTPEEFEAQKRKLLG